MKTKKQNKHIIIDADSLIYRAATLNEEMFDFGEGGSITEVDYKSATECLKESLDDILKETNARDYKAYITGSNNFRYEILPSYKSNRKDIKKPELLNALSEFAMSELDFIKVDGMEADDACCIDMTKEKGCILCHIDKDLNQIAGTHYNWNKKEFYEVSEQEGLEFFYMQVLTGDPSDGYKGCHGVGKVKAYEAIKELIEPLPIQDYKINKHNKEEIPFLKWVYMDVIAYKDLEVTLWNIVVSNYQKALATSKNISTIEEYNSLRDEAQSLALTQAKVAYMLKSKDIKKDGEIIGFKCPILGGGT
ncbi:hypothetical protein [Campylobacter hyointestinalis]|uniref:hypothetical protein n=1 Tax=Campylobacter hyointestinalis TaxID=198 RepID=UPI000CE4269C|nr:hypothetical protein [Campylobacter hyointestinalis]PPB55985.1 hypothetical protein CDQ67_01740 [Campylobacter hyointestinalis subsp. hyointestinalis]